MRTIGKVIEGMDHLDDVMPMLARLGRSHAMMGIKPAYFATLKECLMEALAEHLGAEAFAGAIEAAWGAAFDAIASVIISHISYQNEGGPASSTFDSQVVGF